MTKNEVIEQLMYLKHLERTGSRADIALDAAIEAIDNYDDIAWALNSYAELYRKLKEKYERERNDKLEK